MKHKGRGLLIALVVSGVSFFLVLFAQERNQSYVTWGDPVEGRRVYAEKGCGHCHAIHGVGPDIGPDLGRIPKEWRTLSQMAGVMWNHAPVMRETASEMGVQWKPFKGSEVRDLMTFIYSLRLLDRPGDPQKGKRVFEQKNCGTCHTVQGEEAGIGPAVEGWPRYGSPILWAETMWKHALEMESKMRDMGLAWPKFKDEEFIDLIAFIQSEHGEKR